MIGIDRFVQDLHYAGFGQTAILEDAAGMKYAVIEDYVIPAGSFSGKAISLAIPVPADYPRSAMASIHIKATPHLVPFAHTGTRNVIQSPLGGEWQYWSYLFSIRGDNPTFQIMSKINAIFRDN